MIALACIGPGHRRLRLGVDRGDDRRVFRIELSWLGNDRDEAVVRDVLD
jgi:hypothetical protein